MTVAAGRICAGKWARGWRGTTARLSRLVPVVALALAQACNDPPPRPPTPPRELVPPVALAGPDETPVDQALGPTDAWFEAYSGYMSRPLQREYRNTPPNERFERFGLQLLDYQLREDLLHEHQDELTRDERDDYRTLPSADECRRFIAEHAKRSAPSSRGGTAPIGTASAPGERK
jgi:hypothetical protein